MGPPAFTLERDAFGALVHRDADGREQHGVVPVRAFPIAAPDEAIALLAADGHELAWFDRLDELPAAARALVEEEFAQREFMPRIRRLAKVSGFACPSTWTVDTDRGATDLVLKGEEDIRRIGPNALLVTDAHGIQFLVPDVAALDRDSRRLLDRFL
ncbi:MAG TPA: DUF1854 domain-containing protein [Rhodocyclaceae bacterium]|nr:DUF1854 domain-containing protein [Rhodocyclaceae bacterium]